MKRGRRILVTLEQLILFTIYPSIIHSVIKVCQN